jgi:hypothetical protein
MLGEQGMLCASTSKTKFFEMSMLEAASQGLAIVHDWSSLGSYCGRTPLPPKRGTTQIRGAQPRTGPAEPLKTRVMHAKLVLRMRRTRCDESAPAICECEVVMTPGRLPQRSGSAVRW